MKGFRERVEVGWPHAFEPVLGAVGFANRAGAWCVDLGAQVVSVTDRPAAMRVGTASCRARRVRPQPGGRVALPLRASAEADDELNRTKDDRLACMRIARVEVAAAFASEPIHVNGCARRFLRAIAVHFATQHASRELQLEQRVVSVPAPAWYAGEGRAGALGPSAAILRFLEGASPCTALSC
jgi:hypothetical protein